MSTSRLSPCPSCHEASCVTRVYTRKRDGSQRRIRLCINKGCRYVLELLFPEEVAKQEVN